METFLSTFEERKNEINGFVVLVESLENKNMLNDDFMKQHFPEVLQLIGFSAVDNILKSNIYLMIYNIIEYTITGLLDVIYSKIKTSDLNYNEVSIPMQKLWRKTFLKRAYDPLASYSSYVNTVEKLVEHISKEKSLQLTPKKTIPGGNIDCKTIETVLQEHGMEINKRSENFRPDILENIKNDRNSLAHGSTSFSTKTKDDSLNDVKIKKEIARKTHETATLTNKPKTSKKSI